MNNKNLTPLQEAFWQFLRLNPTCTTYLCYAAAVRGRDISDKAIEISFDLIDEIEFLHDKKMREDILKTLSFLAKDKCAVKEPHKLESYEIHYLGVRTKWLN